MNGGGPKAAIADHRELRARADGGAGHFGHLALADEPAAGRYHARRCSGTNCCGGWSPTPRAEWSPRSPARCCLTTAACSFRPMCATRIISRRPTPSRGACHWGRRRHLGSVELTPDPNNPGMFQAEWTRRKTGILCHRGDREARAKDAAGSQEIGRDVLTFAAHGRRGREFPHRTES